MADSNEKNEPVDVDMGGGEKEVPEPVSSSPNKIPTSTTGEEDITNGDGETAEGRNGGGRGGGRGRGGGGRYNRRGGRGRGGRSSGYRGRNARRHTPYDHPNNRTNDDDDEDQHDNDNDEDRGRRVYVGNLSWDVGWTDLKEHMKTTECEVTRADVMMGYDGRSKGCGIVEFATSEGARRAVLTLNDTELMGRQIFVREDREVRGSGGGAASTSSGGGGDGDGGESTNTGSGGDAQSRRCYVGNLSWDVAWQDLKDHMRQEGEVLFAEVMTEADGRSKGCGIVEYATPEEAQNAIANLTDTDLKGRMIFVREDREIGGGGNASGGGGQSHQSASVYVGNLAFETSWQDLKDHMRGAGNVDQANVLTGDDGRSKGCGIVLFQRPQDAQRAIRELHNSQLHGRPILVREDREQGGSGGGGRRGGHGSAAGTQLFVGNLSFDTTWRELKDHFRQCGDVERAEVMEGPDGRRKGFGTVKFYRQKDANNAIRRLNGTELQGRDLEVRLDLKA